MSQPTALIGIKYDDSAGSPATTYGGVYVFPECNSDDETTINTGDVYADLKTAIETYALDGNFMASSTYDCFWGDANLPRPD